MFEAKLVGQLLLWCSTVKVKRLIQICNIFIFNFKFQVILVMRKPF